MGWMDRRWRELDDCSSRSGASRAAGGARLDACWQGSSRPGRAVIGVPGFSPGRHKGLTLEVV